jgi:hypothetical protein
MHTDGDGDGHFQDYISLSTHFHRLRTLRTFSLNTQQPGQVLK